ncbi:MAG: (4Fe-4S)-binding protein [Eubacteriales bacterium]|nr:(4Fe-4S)-binding protein [Eubacteriales bacterium]MDD3350141.1 (4Fe-4S)-binding protein [Eubacteriales bacterium]
MKDYKNKDITVHWLPELCTHPGTCLRLLPEVFSLGSRPWINVDGSTPEKIMRAIDECPSGALRYSLPEGSSVDPNEACGVGNLAFKKPSEEPVKIKVIKNGPLLIDGNVILIDSAGEIIKEDCKMALCSCGRSKNPPFCDGTHRHPK